MITVNTKNSVQTTFNNNFPGNFNSHKHAINNHLAIIMRLENAFMLINKYINT